MSVKFDRTFFATCQENLDYTFINILLATGYPCVECFKTKKTFEKL